MYVLRKVSSEIKRIQNINPQTLRSKMMKESEKKVSKNRDPNLAFMKAMKMSEALANIVGSDHFLRT